MKGRKVVILGAGHVGSHAAYALAQDGLCSEIVLVDKDMDKAVSQALDVDDSMGSAGGQTLIRAGGYHDVSDAAVVINAIGEKVGMEIGAQYLCTDFKKREGYKRSIELSKEYDLYRQNYCGCGFSKREAQERDAK